MRLNISRDLFIGKAEASHLQESLGEKGYKRFIQQISLEYGVVKLPSDTSFNALRIQEGTSADRISINPGMTIDDQGNSVDIEALLEDVLTLPTDGVDRWIKINWTEDVIEEGTVTISTTGQLTGIGTNFTKVLRGLPDFPSKIEFIGSANTSEYVIASVSSDTSAQLNIAAGQLVGESNLRYRIIGTFTPGIVPSTSAKYPLRKDGFELVAETNANVIAGQQFLLAKVSTDGTTMIITSEREQNIYKIASTQSTSVGLQLSNSVIGLESLRYGGSRNDHQYNYATVGWGLRVGAGNWNYNSNLTQVTIFSGQGGIWKDLSQITAGDLDNWFIFHKDSGQFLRILSTGLSGGNVVLTTVTPSQGFSVSGEITVVPSSDGIEIITSTSDVPSANSSYYLPIHLAVARIPLIAGHDNRVFWRHIRGSESSSIQSLNTGDYLDESQFDVDGNQLTTTYSTHTSGDPIAPILDPLNHSDDKASRSQDNDFTGKNNVFKTGSIADHNVLKTEGILNIDRQVVLTERYSEFDASTPNPIALTMTKPYYNVKFTGSPGLKRSVIGITRYDETNGDVILISNHIDSVERCQIVLKHNSSSFGGMFFKNQRDVVLLPGTHIELIWSVEKDAWLEKSSGVTYSPVIHDVTNVSAVHTGTTPSIQGTCEAYIHDNTVTADFYLTVDGEVGFELTKLVFTNMYDYLPQPISLGLTSIKTVSGASPQGTDVNYVLGGVFNLGDGSMTLMNAANVAMTGVNGGSFDTIQIIAQIKYNIANVV